MVKYLYMPCSQLLRPEGDQKLNLMDVGQQQITAQHEAGVRRSCCQVGAELLHPDDDGCQ